jgi:hypothetical protein
VDLTKQAVGKAPAFYALMPTPLKTTNKTTLALTALVAAKGGALIDIVNDVLCHCPLVFSDDGHTAVAKVLDTGNEMLVHTILVEFGDQVVWYVNLVEIVVDCFQTAIHS